jgi:hypothetical protein
MSPETPVQTRLIVPELVMGFVPDSVIAPHAVVAPFTLNPTLVTVPDPVAAV